MKVIVVGCGKIGSTIISSLVDEGHNVVAVDTDPQVIDNLTNIYDIMGVCGSGTDCDTLKDAGVENTDLLVAVTTLDELNMLCCFIARKMGAMHTIARIRKPEYNMNNIGFLRQQLDLSMSINPEHLAAEEIYNILRLPYATKIETFSQRNFEIVEIILREGSPMINSRLMDIRSKFNQNFLVCLVQRGENVYIPDGNFVLQSGDKIGLTASLGEMQKLMRSLGVETKQAKKVMLLGGSRIAYYLSHMLSYAGSSVKLIEKDEEKADSLSKTVSAKTVVINGDGAQQELLLEEGLSNTDAFVSLTGMDEENILISIFASVSKVPKVVAKINRRELIGMAEKLGLDSIISPRKIAADVIVRYARALENSKGSNVEALYKVMDDKAEVLEFKVSGDFSGINIPIKDLHIKKNIIIGGIIRNRKAIIPSGFDKIEAGDRVIVVAAGGRLNDLSDILQ